MTDKMTACPCQSGLVYQTCCGPLHRHSSQAETAEQLMRSRFSAFCLGEVDYLLDTLHPSQHQPNEREALQKVIAETAWLGLRIVKHKSSGDSAEVEFVAFYQDQPLGQLHERSRFHREDGQWFYVDGEFLPAIKLGRNEPCICGSGKMVKHCHS